MLIKYTKSVLWRVAKRLCYIEDARCLMVNGLDGFSQIEQLPILRPQQRFFFCGNSPVITIRCGLGHHDHQSSSHLTSSCGGFHKKDSAAVTQKVWKTLIITEKNLLKSLSNKLFRKLHYSAKGVNACVKEGGRYVHYMLSLHVSTF